MRLPSRIGKKENFRLAAKQRHHRQLAYPTNAETRMMFQRVILAEYEKLVGGSEPRSPSERLRVLEQLKTDSRSDIILEAPFEFNPNGFHMVSTNIGRESSGRWAASAGSIVDRTLTSWDSWWILQPNRI